MQTSAGGSMRSSARALATMTAFRPSASTFAASSLQATERGLLGFPSNGKSLRSAKRNTRSSPRYAETLRANATAASSPATMTSVHCGWWAYRAATMNGRADDATPSVASSPASSFPQNVSSASEYSRAYVSDSMSMVCIVPTAVAAYWQPKRDGPFLVIPQTISRLPG